jgi:hypothetical protein
VGAGAEEIDLSAVQAGTTGIESAYDNDPLMRSFFSVLCEYKYLFSAPDDVAAQQDEESLKQDNAPIHKLDCRTWLYMANFLPMRESVALRQTCPLFVRWGNMPELWKSDYYCMGSSLDAPLTTKKYMVHMRSLIWYIFAGARTMLGNQDELGGTPFADAFGGFIRHVLTRNNLSIRPYSPTIEGVFQWLTDFIVDHNEPKLIRGLFACLQVPMLAFLDFVQHQLRSKVPVLRANQLLTTLLLSAREPRFVESFIESNLDILLSNYKDNTHHAFLWVLRSPETIVKYRPKLILPRLPSYAPIHDVPRIYETLTGTWRIFMRFTSVPTHEEQLESGFFRLVFSYDGLSSNAETHSRSKEDGLARITTDPDWPSFDSMGPFEFQKGLCRGNIITFSRKMGTHANKMLFSGTATNFGFGGSFEFSPSPNTPMSDQLRGCWFMFQCEDEELNSIELARKEEAKSVQFAKGRDSHPDRFELSTTDRIIMEIRSVSAMQLAAGSQSCPIAYLEAMIAQLNSCKPSSEDLEVTELPNETEWKYQRRIEALKLIVPYLSAVKLALLRSSPHLLEEAVNDLSILKEGFESPLAKSATRKWAMRLAMTTQKSIFRALTMLVIHRVSQVPNRTNEKVREEATPTQAPPEDRKRKEKKSRNVSLSTGTIIAIFSVVTAIAAIGAFSLAKILNKRE